MSFADSWHFVGVWGTNGVQKPSLNRQFAETTRSTEQRLPNAFSILIAARPAKCCSDSICRAKDLRCPTWPTCSGTKSTPAWNLCGVGGWQPRRWREPVHAVPRRPIPWQSGGWLWRGDRLSQSSICCSRCDHHSSLRPLRTAGVRRRPVSSAS